MSPLTERQQEIIREKIEEHPNKSKEEIRDELGFEAPLQAIAALMRGMRTRALHAQLSKEDRENIKAGNRLNKSNQEISEELKIDVRSVEDVRKRTASRLKKIDQMGPEEKWEARPENSTIMYPEFYIPKKIRPEIRNNNTDAEIVWTFLVAKGYENEHKNLAKRLCGRDEELPENSRIWVGETHLQPTRENEGNSWKTCADLSTGHLESIENYKMKIRSKGSWVCICEAKWKIDISVNKHFEGTNQLSKLIEHALLLHDKKGVFPERVYVTLITPECFRNVRNASDIFFKKEYQRIFRAYKQDNTVLERDLRKCPLDFLDYDTNTLISRISALRLNWVTYEELLGLPNLIEKCVPGKYRLTIKPWKEICEKAKKAGLSEVYAELMGNQ